MQLPPTNPQQGQSGEWNFHLTRMLETPAEVAGDVDARVEVIARDLSQTDERRLPARRRRPRGLVPARSHGRGRRAGVEALHGEADPGELPAAEALDERSRGVGRAPDSRHSRARSAGGGPGRGPPATSRPRSTASRPAPTRTPSTGSLTSARSTNEPATPTASTPTSPSSATGTARRPSSRGSSTKPACTPVPVTVVWAYGAVVAVGGGPGRAAAGSKEVSAGGVHGFRERDREQLRE